MAEQPKNPTSQNPEATPRVPSGLPQDATGTGSGVGKDESILEHARTKTGALGAQAAGAAQSAASGAMDVAQSAASTAQEYAEEAYEKGTQIARQAYDQGSSSLEMQIRRDPILSVAIAFGIGFLAAYMLTRRD